MPVGAAKIADGAPTPFFPSSSSSLSRATDWIEVLSYLPPIISARTYAHTRDTDWIGVLCVSILMSNTEASQCNTDTEAILSNFCDAIFDPSVELISHAPEGINGVELANAMVYAGLTGETVSLPMDGSKFESLLKQLIQGSHKDMGAVVPAPHPLVAEVLARCR